MARTKQTARKQIIGAKAPRKFIGTNVARKTVPINDMGIKRPRRFRPGTVALYHYKKYKF